MLIYSKADRNCRLDKNHTFKIYLWIKMCCTLTKLPSQIVIVSHSFRINPSC